MHDLVAASLRLFVGRVDVVDLDSHDRVLRRGRVASHDLDARIRVRGVEPGHPALVHAVLSEPEEPEELPRALDIGGAQVGDDL